MTDRDVTRGVLIIAGVMVFVAFVMTVSEGKWWVLPVLFVGMIAFFLLAGLLGRLTRRKP